MTAQETLDRSIAPRVGDMCVWRDSRVTVKSVAADGTVSALLECENWYSDFTMTAAGWRESVARTLSHDGVTFTPALDNAAPPVVQCAT